MRLRLSILLALLATVVLTSLAFAKGPVIDPAAKSAVVPQLQVVDRAPADNLDEILASADFEGTFPGTGWTRTITNANFTWVLSNVTFYAGTGACQAEYDPALVPQNEWLISPVIDLSNADAAYQIDFYWFWSYYWGVSPNDNYDLEVRISTDGGTTWLPEVLWVEDDYGVFSSFVWYPATVDITSYAGNANVKIGFRYVGSDGAQGVLDNIVISSIVPGGTLAGTVTNSESTTPISGVEVSVVGTGSTAVTNAGGTYSIGNIAPGTYTVEFENPLFVAGSSTGVVITLGETTTLNMALDPLPVIANDNCNDPFVIESVGTFPFTTANATYQTTVAELPASCDEGYGVFFAPDVWASWIAPTSGDAIFSLCDDADFDTRMACYSTGTSECAPCPTTNADLLACNDDGANCGGFTSILEFPVEAGVCYLIRIGGYAGAAGVGEQGSGNLTVTLTAPPIPAIGVSTTELDFGIVEVGVPTILTFTVNNTAGTAPLQVTSITCPTGYTATPGAFGIPGGSTTARTITVTLNAPSAGVYEGDLAINSNDPTTPTLVHVSGGTTAANENPGLADNFYVATNYPNPFNPETTVSFAIPRAENVVLTVYNSVGQAVATLNNGRLDAGRHNFTFNGADLPSGLYFARITSDGFTQTLKTVLLK